MTEPEDPPDDRFLRDPSDLEGFLDEVRSDPAEGGAPEPDAGPVEAPREVRVDVEQARLAEEAGREGPEQTPQEGGFWGSGFQPAAGADGAGDGAGETGRGLEEKLDELEQLEDGAGYAN